MSLKEGINRNRPETTFGEVKVDREQYLLKSLLFLLMYVREMKGDIPEGMEGLLFTGADRPRQLPDNIRVNMG